jgi:hypothetical protein
MNKPTLRGKAWIVGSFAVLLGLAALPVSAVAGDPENESGWIGTMFRAVTTAQAAEGDEDGSLYAPYLAQLHIVGTAAERHDERGIYAAMNRFMDMLERREHGIAPIFADWLFDYCMTVTPPKFHDVSRHIRKIMMDDGGSGVDRTYAAMS